MGSSGAEEFGALARRLKAAGETGLRKELYDRIGEAAQPIARKVTDPAHLRAYLPNRYADAMGEDLALTVSRLTGRSPGVSIRARSRGRARKLRRLDQGVLWHPVFGDREDWKLQRVRPGFFSDPAQDAAPEVREKILQAMSDVARKITTRS